MMIRVIALTIKVSHHHHNHETIVICCSVEMLSIVDPSSRLEVFTSKNTTIFSIHGLNNVLCLDSLTPVRKNDYLHFLYQADFKTFYWLKLSKLRPNGIK